MPNYIRNENDQRSFYEAQSRQGYLKRQSWTAPAAGTATYIHAGITTAALITSGITDPDFARVPVIVGGGSSHNATGNVTLNGTNIRGQVITETKALNGNTPVNFTKAFKTIISIDTTDVSGIGVNATVEVGVTNLLGLSRCMSEDSYLQGNANGVLEGTRASITYSSTNVELNTVDFNTTPNGSDNFVAWFMTTELTTAA